MIVKVQLSLSSSDGVRYVYIYSKDRSVVYQGEADEAIIDLMQDRPKAYFEGEIDEKNRIALGNRVEDQNW